MYTQPARSYSSDSNTDDAQHLDDPAITNPFTSSEMVLLDDRYKTAHKMYQKARVHNFGNAWGKFFMTGFLKLVLTLNKDFKVYHTTSSSGDSQPGMCSVQCKLLKKGTRQNQEEAVAAMHTFNCYPDFTVQKESICHTVGEIKSTDSAAIGQNLERMIGLFKPNQMMMLGLVIWPHQIQPQILYRIRGTFELHRQNEIFWNDEKSLEELYHLSALHLW